MREKCIVILKFWGRECLRGLKQFSEWSALVEVAASNLSTAAETRDTISLFLAAASGFPPRLKHTHTHTHVYAHSQA